MEIFKASNTNYVPVLWSRHVIVQVCSRKPFITYKRKIFFYYSGG